MSDQALIVRNDNSLTIAFTAAAEAIKEDALSVAALIGKVTNATENDAASAAQQKLSTIRRTVEKARKEAKAPVLAFEDQIDSAAKSFVAEIADEEKRIGALIGDFFSLEEARKRAAAEAARLEAEKIERDRRAEEQRIFREQAEKQAALQREADEKLRVTNAARDAAEKAIREAKSEKARLEAEALAAKHREQAEREAIELKRQQELATAQSHAQLDAAQERASNAQAAVFTAPMAPTRAQGQTVKADLDITVTDIWALARAHPGMVNIEPRLSEIKAAIRSGAKVAGVTYKEIFKSQTLGRAQKAIEV